VTANFGFLLSGKKNRAMNRIFRPEGNEVSEWRTLHDKELHSLFSSFKIIRMNKPRYKLEEYQIWENQERHKNVVRKPCGKDHVRGKVIDGRTLYIG